MAVADAFVLIISAELGLKGGVESSPNKSMFLGAGRGLGMEALDDDAASSRWELDRSLFAFSCTSVNGISSSPSASSVEGSGIGPSITHRFVSYFVRMKFSILASDG